MLVFNFVRLRNLLEDIFIQSYKNRSWWSLACELSCWNWTDHQQRADQCILSFWTLLFFCTGSQTEI